MFEMSHCRVKFENFFTLVYSILVFVHIYWFEYLVFISALVFIYSLSYLPGEAGEPGPTVDPRKSAGDKNVSAEGKKNFLFSKCKLKTNSCSGNGFELHLGARQMDL